MKDGSPKKETGNAKEEGRHPFGGKEPPGRKLWGKSYMRISAQRRNAGLNYIAERGCRLPPRRPPKTQKRNARILDGGEERSESRKSFSRRKTRCRALPKEKPCRVKERKSLGERRGERKKIVLRRKGQLDKAR